MAANDVTCCLTLTGNQLNFMPRQLVIGTDTMGQGWARAPWRPHFYLMVGTRGYIGGHKHQLQGTMNELFCRIFWS